MVNTTQQPPSPPATSQKNEASSDLLIGNIIIDSLGNELVNAEPSLFQRRFTG